VKPLRPAHIAVFIWLSIGLLGLICWLWPENNIYIGDMPLRFQTLSQALHLNDRETPEYAEMIIEPDTAVVDTISEKTAVQPVIRDSLTSGQHQANLRQTDNSQQALLSSFYTALQSADRTSVRVVHYGDSQIEEDRISYRLRRSLQAEYGGNGYGLIPLHQTIPTRTLEQRLLIDGVIQSVNGGPRRSLVYGPRSMRRDDGMYGPMGQVAELNGTESVEMRLRPRTDKHYSENYFSRIRLLADSGITLSVNDDSVSHSGIIRVADSTMECSLHIHGAGKVYGLSLESPTGVIVDNIPMRGSSGAVFTQIDSAQLSNFYRETNTRLIILQFGGNSLPNITNENYIYGAVNQLRKQVQYLKRCAPEASILFIGPSDMATVVDGTLQTYPLLPLMDSQLRRMAEKEEIAYFSMYHAMGGYGSMIKWVDLGLAGSDYVHFTRAGADKAAKLLLEWIF
jgi:lysophospholipase L1-like esterase